MKLDQATLQKLAEHLENCELNAQDTLKITDQYSDMDFDDAYAIQEIIRDRKIARGARIIGLKAGLTSFAKRKELLPNLVIITFIHVIYFIYIGLAGNKGKYEWKGRSVN